MSKYVCIRVSNSSYPAQYDVDTKSAMKCAAEIGRCEGGEVITVCRKNGRVLSRVMWSPENGGEYFRAYVPADEYAEIANE